MGDAVVLVIALRQKAQNARLSHSSSSSLLIVVVVVAVVVVVLLFLKVLKLITEPTYCCREKDHASNNFPIKMHNCPDSSELFSHL